MSHSELTIEDAVANPWDVIVVGAGPAGTLAALLLSRRGLKTLLVERKSFPRDKVCGGCLNARGAEVLKRAGVGHVLEGSATSALDQIEVVGRRQRVACNVQNSLAILRSDMDNRLVSAARISGVSFLENTLAHVDPDLSAGARTVSLADSRGLNGTARAKVVLACDGLAGSSLVRIRYFEQRVSSRSRIGAGAVLSIDDKSVRPHCLHMAIGSEGYVGRMRLADGRICLGAAMDPSAVRRHGVTETVCRILAECRSECVSLYADCRIQGTVPLSRRPKCTSRDQIFLVGDACGYVEPLTGEGMALALETAEAVVPLVIESMAGWHEGLERNWARTVRNIALHRRMVCWSLSRACRWPALVDLTLASASRVPRVLNSILSQISYLPHETPRVGTWHSI